MHEERLAFVGSFEFFGCGIGGDGEEIVVCFVFVGREEGAAATEYEGEV